MQKVVTDDSVRGLRASLVAGRFDTHCYGCTNDRSPRRGRSRSRSMSPRSSRSRSPREERRKNRSRSPLNSAQRYEEDAAGQRVHGGKEANQEKRVYVGNLSYDAKWHQLKDYMRAGTVFPHSSDQF
jgi:hypothetical protein